MDTQLDKSVPGKFAFSSSVSGDVWHPGKDEKSYEWWYFDALSDDARDAIVVVFLDDFVYSADFNHDSRNVHPRPKSPAVAFTYFRDGAVYFRTILKFPEAQFMGGEAKPEVRMGNCSFVLETRPYGSAYQVRVELPMSGNKRITAELEWLSIESNFAPDAACIHASAHCWNLVAPRSDVSGRITVYDRKDREKDVFQFRGTGYHDHKLDNRWLAKIVRDWHWGRAHFADATVVFYRYRETDDEQPATKMIIVKDGDLIQRDVEFVESEHVRDKFGLRYPTRLSLIASEGIELRLRRIKVIDSNFFYLRFLSEISFSFDGDEQRTTTGISEFLSPKTLNQKWMTMLGDLRTGKDGRGPILP